MPSIWLQRELCGVVSAPGAARRQPSIQLQLGLPTCSSDHRTATPSFTRPELRKSLRSISKPFPQKANIHTNKSAQLLQLSAETSQRLAVASVVAGGRHSRSWLSLQSQLAVATVAAGGRFSRSWRSPQSQLAVATVAAGGRHSGSWPSPQSRLVGSLAPAQWHLGQSSEASEI